jgi:hypothetical protein
VSEESSRLDATALSYTLSTINIPVGEDDNPAICAGKRLANGKELS